ncbi:MAG: DinB family protein [Ignavibacteriaceae bacterium]|nr:DinB family protein [Ignavibacteriaceae bacterium]
MTEELKKIIDRFQEHINVVPSKFLKYSEVELNAKPATNKWSKKELLGHLIDSAANNHHRFVKIQFMPSPFFVEGYAQNDWVRIQNYNEKDTKQLVNLWKVYNEHILFLMQNTPEENLNIKIEAEDPFENADTLLFLMKDYVDHMDHHLKQIFT